jgi:hypothetical protein
MKFKIITIVVLLGEFNRSKSTGYFVPTGLILNNSTFTPQCIYVS